MSPLSSVGAFPGANRAARALELMLSALLGLCLRADRLLSKKAWCLTEAFSGVGHWQGLSVDVDSPV